MQSFLVAVSFLTIVPVRFRKLPPPEMVARARFWFPVVGLLLGSLLGGWTALVGTPGSPALGAFLILVVWVGVTGALHIDGLADLCDGLFGGATPEERLRIMKEPQVGTFGVVGVVALLLGKFAALNELLAHAPLLAPALVMLSVWQGRAFVLLLAAGASYPRAEGTGKAIIEATPGRDPIALGWAFAVGIFGLAALHAVSGGLLWALPLLAVLAIRLVCDRRLGGVTGDCLGAGIEMVEWAFLLTAAFLASRGILTA